MEKDKSCTEEEEEENLKIRCNNTNQKRKIQKSKTHDAT